MTIFIVVALALAACVAALLLILLRLTRKEVRTEGQHRLAKGIRWTARIIGLGASGFFLSYLIGGAIFSTLAEQPIPWETRLSLMTGFSVIALAGCIISWWRERLAGILLISVAIAFAILSGLLAFGIVIVVVPGTNEVESWSMSEWLVYGLPYLIAGVLFLSSWWLSRKPSPSALPPSPTS